MPKKDKSSDLPWMLGSVGFTIPAVAWLISAESTPSPDHHDDKHQRLTPQEATTDHEEQETKPEEQQESANENSKQEGEGDETKGDNVSTPKNKKNSSEQSAQGGLGGDEDAKTETNKPGKKDERTLEGTERISNFGGKPNVTPDTEDAEDKNTGQKHADTGKDRHKTDITQVGGGNMPKTQDTVRK